LRKSRRKVGGTVLFFDPGDSVVRNLHSCLAERGEPVEETCSLRVLLATLWRSRLATVTLTRRLRFSRLLSSYTAILLLVLARVKFFIFFSSDYVDLVESPVSAALFYMLNRLLVRRADKVFILRTRGHIVRRYKLPQSRVVYFDNYYREAESARFSLPDSIPAEIAGKRIFLYAGYNLWWHGLDKFVLLFRELRKRFPDVLLLVVGPTAPTPFLRCFARERRYWLSIDRMRSEDSVVFLGQRPREELNWWMRRADFFVGCMDGSSTQGRTELRTCVIEAMAVGAPCINVESPELAETGFFRDGENVILLGDDQDENVEKLSFYLQMPFLRKKLGEHAKRTAKQVFQVERWVEELPGFQEEGSSARVYEMKREVSRAVGDGAAVVFGSAPVSDVKNLIHRVRETGRGSVLLIASRSVLGRFAGEEAVEKIPAGEKWISWLGLGLKNIVALRRRHVGTAFIPVTTGRGEGYGNVSRAARALGARRIVFVRDGKVVGEKGSGLSSVLYESLQAVIETGTVILGAVFGLAVVLVMEGRSALFKARLAVEGEVPGDRDERIERAAGE